MKDNIEEKEHYEHGHNHRHHDDCHDHCHGHCDGHEHGEKENFKLEVIKVVISLVLFLIAILVPFQNEIIKKVIFFLSYIVVGYETVFNAIRNILHREVFDECFLMSIASIGAIAIGELPEACAVMIFYQIGELFQDYAVDKSKDSIEELMDIRPDYANVIRNNREEKVDPDEVKIDEIIAVKPGEKIPLDGVIIEGNSSLDTRALTGESMPRDVKENDIVVGGCINQTGLLKIRVTKEFGESTVSKILDLVQNSSNKKSKSEKFTTKFARVYTPAVVLVALLLAIIPPLVIKGAVFADWIYRALSFLVVSCPCALVISIPLSFFGGIGGASRRGILIKGSNYLEELSKTEMVVFDKTGTLTEGVFEVQKVNPVELIEEELITIAAHAEHYSNHPISKSVKDAYGKEIDETRIGDIREIPGKGIEVKIDNRNVLIGNEKLMQENNIIFEKSQDIGTILYVAVDKKYAGFILISDKIKEDSKKAVSELKSSNKKVVMLTGDKKEVGEDVAQKLKLDKVYSELLPDGKVKIVEELIGSNKDGKVVFCGDGVNDAPVLALADIGIAMGALGSDAAIEAADVVIMTDEPSKIKIAIDISKKTMRIVKENIVFAIGVKILVLVLSALGLSNMWQAVFADVGVTIIAVINATRMLWGKK